MAKLSSDLNIYGPNRSLKPVVSRTLSTSRLPGCRSPSAMAEEPTKAGSAGGGDLEGEDEQVVNPWEVTAKDGGKIDYDKLIEKFGCQRLDESLVRRVERLTGRPAHVFLRRGVFFAHRSDNFCLLNFYPLSVFRCFW